jgi:hypothetical protein
MDGATVVVELDDAGGNQVDLDRAFLNGPMLDDKNVFLWDNLAAGSYTIKVSVFTDGSPTNDTIRVKFEGPSAGPTVRRRP